MITEDEIALGRFQKTLKQLIKDLSGEMGLGPRDVPTYQPLILLAFLSVWHDGIDYQRSNENKDHSWDADNDLTPVVNIYDHKKTTKTNGKRKPRGAK